MVSLASMATPVDDNVTVVAKNEVFGIINFVAMYYEKRASGNAFLKKKTKQNISEQKFTESK